jgi:hypothetical protein
MGEKKSEAESNTNDDTSLKVVDFLEVGTLFWEDGKGRGKVIAFRFVRAPTVLVLFFFSFQKGSWAEAECQKGKSNNLNPCHDIIVSSINNHMYICTYMGSLSTTYIYEQ